MDNNATRAQLYERLNDIVQQLVSLDSADAETEFFPTSWGLVIGCEYFDEDQDLVGSIGWYPKDGSQPLWKSIGLLQMAAHKLTRN